MEKTVSPELKRLFKASLAFRGVTQADWSKDQHVVPQHTTNMLMGFNPSRRLVTEIHSYVLDAVEDMKAAVIRIRKAGR